LKNSVHSRNFVNSARLQKFWKITQDQQTHDHAVAFQNESRVPKWINKAAWTEPALNIQRVAIQGDISQDIQAPGVRLVLGRSRGATMDLLIVGDMSYLREMGTEPSQQVCDLIFVVGRGLPVIGSSTWRAVGGNPSKLTASQIVFHKAPTADKRRNRQFKKVLFRYSEDFKLDHLEVWQALVKCSQMPGSKWKVQLDKGSPGMPVAALPDDTQLVELTTLASLGKWIISARVLQKFGCRGFQVISG